MSGLSGVLIANLCTHIFYCYVDPCKMDGAINTRSCKAKYIFGFTKYTFRYTFDEILTSQQYAQHREIMMGVGNRVASVIMLTFPSEPCPHADFSK